nr:hypothetical protein [uncultured Desulfobacter sp.]
MLSTSVLRTENYLFVGSNFPVLSEILPDKTLGGISIDLCFFKLISNRVDLVPTQKREAYKAFERLGLSKEQYPVSILPELSSHYNYYGFSKKKHAELKHFKAAFDQELKIMKDSG